MAKKTMTLAECNVILRLLDGGPMPCPSAPQWKRLQRRGYVKTFNRNTTLWLEVTDQGEEALHREVRDASKAWECRCLSCGNEFASMFDDGTFGQEPPYLMTNRCKSCGVEGSHAVNRPTALLVHRERAV